MVAIFILLFANRSVFKQRGCTHIPSVEPEAHELGLVPGDT